MNSTPTTTRGFDESRARALLAGADRWAPKKRAIPEAEAISQFAAARAALLSSLALLPETVTLPYHLTPEGERWAKFKRVCDEMFLGKLDLAKVLNRAAFDRIAAWDGSFPGPCATGPTGLGKSWAAWYALRQLYVTNGRTFAWFPVRRLVTELARYEKADCSDEFFRTYNFHRVLFVDDIDKINWDFESHGQMLFAFFDWIYRTKKPCIITTNRDRKWWAAKMGDAFVRRIFDDAHFEVKF